MGSIRKIMGLAAAVGLAAAPAFAAEKLRVAYVHVFDDAPVVVARDKGFFTVEGIDAQVTMFMSGPTLVKGLVTDQIDLGVLGFTNAITWAAQGADLKIIGKVQEGYHSLIVRNDRGIKSLKDLKGRSLASQAAGSTADIVLKGVVLKSAGLTEKDVNLVYTAPSTALASLRAGRVDSAFLFEPYDSIAKASAPVTEIYEIGKVWPFPCMVVIVPGKLIKERPEAVKKSLAALKRSMEFMKEKPAEAAKILAPSFMAEEGLAMEGKNISPEDIMLKSLKNNIFDWRLAKKDLSRMEELTGVMKDLGILKADVPLSSVVDLRWQNELERQKP
jgi:NitT/TauT family transport system substrate-binding protein